MNFGICGKKQGVSPAQDSMTDLLKCPSSTSLWRQVKRSSLLQDQHLPIVQDGTVHRSPGLSPEGDLSNLVILNTPTYRNDLKVRKGRLQ